jgi:hypothetical protein
MMMMSILPLTGMYEITLGRRSAATERLRNTDVGYDVYFFTKYFLK